uniref:Uncharacterized protein n=1 Tax=Timema cristinae TaxID=61476 RepID=A0A7R9D566_TIMCR|nr:unnamed protein product [Timema cristinae]
MVSNLIIMSGCTAVFSSSLLDDEPITLGVVAQKEDPNSLDQFLHFTEDGICRADGDWSMDYWDPYGLDEGLPGRVETGVLTSTQPEALPPICASHDVTDVLRPAPSILSPASLYGDGYAPTSVWTDLETLDRLISVWLATAFVSCRAKRLRTEEFKTGNRGMVLPLATSPPHHTAGAPPRSLGDGARAPAVVRETGIEVFPQPGKQFKAGPSSAPQPGFSGSVNQVGGALSNSVPLSIVKERIEQLRRFFYTGKEITIHLGAPASDCDAISWLEEQITNLLHRLQDHGVSADNHVGLLLNNTDSTLNPVYVSFRRADQLDDRAVLDNDYLDLYFLDDKQNHFDVITSLTAAFKCGYFCRECRVPFSNKNAHKCESACKKCYAKAVCKDCGRWFTNQTCFDNHKRPGFCRGHRSVCEVKKEKAKVDPFREACTVAGAAMLIYHLSHLKEVLSLTVANGVQTNKRTSLYNGSAGRPISTVFLFFMRFWGCYWHGCSLCYPDRTTPIKNSPHENMETRYEATMACLKRFKNAGYTVVEM